MVRVLALVALLATGVLTAGVQDPVKVPQPPAGAAPLPPVPEPEPTRIERDDLLQRFGARTALEGVWRLEVVRRIGAGVQPATGYLVISREFLSLHLQAQGADGEPALQSAFRRYRVSGNRLLMTTLAGMRNDDGTLMVDAEGLTRVAGFTLADNSLILDTGLQTLEFERIE